jgi:penicillin amidase
VIRRLALWAFGLVLLATGALGTILMATLPKLDGAISVPGASAGIEIQRDEMGIVTIRARSDADAAFALGYAHAQDRLFQMDLTRRLGAGRLSEVIGAPTVETDRFMRRLGLYRAAVANLAHLPRDAQRFLQAYADGVNAYLARRDSLPAPEFLLLGYRPEPWTPADSLVWGRLMAWQLSGNWRDERLRQVLADRLPPQVMQVLWPTNQSHAFLDDPHWTLLGAGASNNWVLAGNRSVTGKPLLANDPHLALDMPAAWYLARLETPAGRLVGATAPGVPLIVIGDNDHVAWGFTTTNADTQDLFVESLLPGGRYATPTGPQPLLKRDETIAVKGGASVVETVLETRHGPLIQIDQATQRAYALAWTGLAPDDGTAAALLAMSRAPSAAAFHDALRRFDSPVQNVVYADDAGAIGFATIGRIPIRKNLLNGSLMPVPGESGDYDWVGMIPFDALPQGMNPPVGYFATANNRITDAQYPYFVTAHWDADYRVDRIRQMIEARPKHDLDSMIAIQRDTYSLAAQTLVPLLLASEPDARLSSWDRRMDRAGDAPLIFDAWIRELAHGLLDDVLGADFSDFWFWDAKILTEALQGGPAAQLCDNPGTPVVEDCAWQVRQAYDRAMKALDRAYGTDPSLWQWGEAHRAHFPHPLFQHLPVLQAWLDPDIPTDGDFFTVDRAVPQVDDPTGASFDDMHGAGLRAVFDLGDLDRSRFVIAGGQSGNPMSSHYADFIGSWRDGVYFAILGRGRNRLTLNPSHPA